MPRLLYKYLQEVYDDSKVLLRKVPFSEQAPWWWPRDRSKMAPISGTLGAFRYCPEGIHEPLAQQVVMAIINDYDCLGLPLPPHFQERPRGYGGPAGPGGWSGTAARCLLLQKRPLLARQREDSLKGRELEGAVRGSAPAPFPPLLPLPLQQPKPVMALASDR